MQFTIHGSNSQPKEKGKENEYSLFHLSKEIVAFFYGWEQSTNIHMQEFTMILSPKNKPDWDQRK